MTNPITTAAEMREAAAKLAEPDGRRPCNCFSCNCGNTDDAQTVAIYDEGKRIAAAILAIPIAEPQTDGRPFMPGEWEAAHKALRPEGLGEEVMSEKLSDRFASAINGVRKDANFIPLRRQDLDAILKVLRATEQLAAAREAMEMARKALEPFSRVAKWLKPPEVDWVQYVPCVSIYIPTGANSHTMILKEADFQRSATALAALDASKTSEKF